MIYLGKHRVIKELDKQIARGQVLHFLTGDGINDTFFYDLRGGTKNMVYTLRDYYLTRESLFDYCVHLTASSGEPTCFNANGQVPFAEVIEPPQRKGPLKRKQNAELSQVAQQGVDAANQTTGGERSVLLRLEEAIKKREAKFLLFLENFEWTAKLYDAQPDTTWIAKIKEWENLPNIMIVVTLKDMELLKKYNFNQSDTFIGFPSAEEIFYAYMRWLFRHTGDDYDLNMTVLDEVAHGMSVGEKTLSACMRILRKVVGQNPREFRLKDFDESIEHGIEEKVPWEKVRLDNETKAKIMDAINTFLQADESQRSRRGMIFSGPPGTGKTLIAKSLASEKQCYFLAPTLAELKGEYIGQSSAKIKRVFDRARANEPTILFIDEADTVFPSRALSGGDSDSYAKDMVNQFLQEIDGAKTGLQKIFVIAATNRPESVDEAIKSRLGQPEEIPLPTKEMRKLIFEDNLSENDVRFELTGKIFEEFLLNKSDKMSGRDITNFVKMLKDTAARLNITIGDNEETAELIAATFVESERKFLHSVVADGIFSRTNIIAPNDNPKRLKDIIGYAPQKAIISRQADFIKASAARKNEYRRMKVEPPKGVLLYGPPGNGKSELAQAVAGEHGFYFFKVLSKDFAAGFASEQISKLDSIFTKTERFSKLTECPGIVLFFDEFDSLAGKGNLNQVVRGSLLNYIADENTMRNRDSKILFMAATNFFDEIDDAMKRKGRIDAHIFLDNPNEQDAVQIFDSFIAEENVVAVSSPTFTRKAYGLLLEEARENYRRGRYPDLSLVTEDKVLNAVLRDIESQRPSGADLKTFYRELKEIAFLADNIREGKLLFDEQVLISRFEATQSTINEQLRRRRRE